MTTSNVLDRHLKSLAEYDLGRPGRLLIDAVLFVPTGVLKGRATENGSPTLL